MKPSDPSEPLFPVRPMEPACQYFLKHGTCKFGQACKFNHPRETLLAGGGESLPAGQLVFVTTNPAQGAMPGEASSRLLNAPSSVQALPQRPTEPNCIYFLRNGSCKYGATCKFHHPLDAVNRNNQVQHPTTMRPTQNARDRSGSAGSLSDSRPHVQQHNVTYAPTANVSYVQPQRLQPITERVRPQQLTHILLPDGQIAVILDPQSLQNVSELNAQDRPKFYQSQTNASIGTLQSMDHINHPVVSPMLTATTNSASNNTFDSSIDLGTNVSYQGQPQEIQSKGPRRSGSGGSLSAYGSFDSGSHLQGDFSQQGSGQMLSQQMSSNQGHASFPQYGAWPMSEGVGQPNQAQVQRPSSADALDRQRRVANSEYAAAYDWPSSGSFSSLPVTDRDTQGGRSYIPMPSSSPYMSNNADTRASYQTYSAERNSSISLSASSEQMRMQGNFREPQESSGDDEGLTMMTSALLTMMDRHESPSRENVANGKRSPTHSSMTTLYNNQSEEVYGSRSEPNLRERADPVRPPPGMMGPPGISVDPVYSSSNFNQNSASSRYPPGGGGYFVGGYDQPTTKSPPWGE